jgi:serine protease
MASFLLHAEGASAFVPVPEGTQGAAPASPGTAAPAPTARLIVRYRDGAQLASPAGATASAQQLSQRAGVPLQHLRTTGGGEQVLSLPAPASQAELDSLVNRLSQDPQVEYVEPDARMFPQQVNDPGFPQQWHYTLPGTGINLPPAWQRATGAGVVVAVLDTGVRPHGDLAARLLPGHDFIADTEISNDGDGRDGDANDPGDFVVNGDPCWPVAGWPGGNSRSSWHGTHVAGTIAAVTNNGTGVAGVAPDARILPVRVLGKCGGFTSDIADGIRWAAGLPVPGVPNNPNPARVLNLSLGGDGACGQTYTNAINAARGAGAVVVVAAGNSDADAGNFQPASCRGVITVAATNRDGARAFFGQAGSGSNFGTAVEIAAPGGETHAVAANGILSTLNAGATTPGADNVAFYQGTSMATPHVAGVAALVLQVAPSLTPDAVLQVLTQTAQPFPAVASRPCTTATCGAGIVDAGAAVARAGAIAGGPVGRGAIWRFTGQACQGESCPGWQLLDNNAASVAIVPAGGQLYQLHNTGRIWQHTGQACQGTHCPGWQMLDNNRATVGLLAANQLFQLHDGGRIWRHTGQACQGESCPGWQMLDNNRATVSLAASGGQLYQLHDSGRIWRSTGQACQGESCPGWQMLDNNGATVAIAAGDALYQLHDSGRIWRFTGQACQGESCPGWQMLDNNGATVGIVAAGGALYQLHDSGRIWRFTGQACQGESCPGWQMLDNNPATINIVAAGNDLIQLHDSGRIWRFTGQACQGESCPGWQMLDNNPATGRIAVSAGNLYQVHMPRQEIRRARVCTICKPD